MSSQKDSSKNSGLKCSSRTSIDSGKSIGIGIDNTKLDQTLLRRNKLDIDLIRPKAANFLQGCDDSTYNDCIMFLIYCSEHDRFAVTDVNNDGTIWLPFVYRDGLNWKKASENGLLSMFEKRDADGSVRNQVNILHKSKMIEMGRMQTTTGRWIQRATQFVTITKCEQTCLPINSIRWMDAGNILKDDSLVWGPEFRKYLEWKNFELHIVEHAMDTILKNSNISTTDERLDKNLPSNSLSEMIRSRNLSQKSLLDLYDHYFRHCFPSFYMNLGSFRIYLHKCGLHSDIIKKESKNLFRLCITRPNRDCKGSSYVDFSDICYLLIGLDPELPNDRPRQAFIQHFHSIHLPTRAMRKHSKSESLRLSPHGSKSPKKLPRRQKTADNYFKKNKSTSLTPTASTKTSTSIKSAQQQQRTTPTTKTDELFNCGFSKSVFNKIKKKKKAKERLVSDKSSLSRGRCRNCRVKNFEYGQHCVMFDSMARCVEPKIILYAENQFQTPSKLEGRKLYSAEFVFKTDSIGNSLFDFIRNRKFLRTNDEQDQFQSMVGINKRMGLSTTSNVGSSYGVGVGSSGSNFNVISNEIDEEANYLNTFITICDNVRKLLKNEPKLIKCSGSTVIIGDIRGNLNSLFALETVFWQSIPVIGNNLIFLGNFTGSGGNLKYSIESIIYLFSMKYLCPQKVFLLKGVQETRTKNEKTLLLQCRKRYGDDNGIKLWKAINRVYDEMPLVCIINETIVCISSGIPKDSITHKLTTLFDNFNDTRRLSETTTKENSKNTTKEFAIFQQFLINAPNYKDDQLDHHQQQQQQQSNSGKNLFKINPHVNNSLLFTKEAFKKFMQLNNFSYMIRSNEPLIEGYRIAFDNRLITIYSNVELDPNNSTKQINIAITAFIHHPSGHIQLQQIDHCDALMNNLNVVKPKKNSSVYGTR